MDVKEILNRPQLVCCHCDRTFIYEQVMNMHKDAMHSNPTELEHEYIFPPVNKKKERVPCQYKNCHETRKSSKSLEKHIRGAHINKSKVCPHCGKTLGVNTSLETHITNIHTGETKLCSKCPYSSKNAGTLRKHFRFRHTAWKQSCEFCGKVVKQLDKHLKATLCGKDVDDRNVVPCPKCPVINRSLSQLRTHIIKFMKELRINTATSVPTQPTVHIT